MNCQHCGKEINEFDQFCGHCGQKVISEVQSCMNCGSHIDADMNVCPQCGYRINKQPQAPVKPKSRVLAGVLGIFFGGLGVHNFYLGYSSKGFFQVVLFLMGFMTLGLTTLIASIWGFVEAILILIGHIDRDVDGYFLGD